MANFYDTPAQSNVVPTYVPIPFEEIVQAGQARQSRQDTELANLYAQQQAIASLPYIPDSDQEKYVMNTVENVNRIARDASKIDLSQGINRRKLKDQLQNNVNLGQLASIARSKQAFDKRNEAIFQLRSQGKYFEPYEQTVDPYLSGTLGMNEYSYMPGAFNDPELTAGELFKSIAPRKFVSTNSRGYIMETTQRDLGQLQEAVASNWRSYADTPQGQWTVTQYRQRTGDNRTSDEDIVKGYLNDVAKRYVVPPQQDFVGIDPEFKGGSGSSKTKDQTFPMNAGSNTQKIANENRISADVMKKNLGFNPDKVDDATELLKKLDFNDEGNLVDKFDSYDWSKISTKLAKTKQENLNRKNTEARKIIQNAKRFNSQLKDKTDFEILGAYVEAYKHLKDVDYNSYLYETDEVSTSTKAIITRQIIDDVGGRKLVVGETKEGGKTVENLGDIYAAFGIGKDSKDRNKENIKVTSFVPAIGMYQASIEVNGVPKNFFISANKNEQGLTDLAVQANKVNDTGQIGEKEITSSGKKYKVATRLEPIIDQNTGAITGYAFGSNIRTTDGTPEFIDMETGEPTNNVSLDEYEAYVAAMVNQMYRKQ